MWTRLATWRPRLSAIAAKVLPGIRGGIRGPIRKCSGPRRWQRRRADFFEPAGGIGAGEALGREREQTERALRGRAPHARLLIGRMAAVDERSRDAHFRQLRHVILHECDERGDHDHRPAEYQRGRRVAQRFAAARWASRRLRRGSRGGFGSCGAEGIVAPVAPERGVEVGHRALRV